MIIKKYVADTMNEALNLIKLELGSQAVIVSKRSVRQKGFLGLLLPKKLEVTAALDEGSKDEPETRNSNTREVKEPDKREFEQELTDVKQMLQQLVDGKSLKKDKRVGIKKLLMQRDVHEDVVAAITNKIKSKDEYKNLSRLPEAAYTDEISSMMNVDPSIQGRIHIFIGPTGVGKTTTIAKLAAIQSLKAKKKVGLITIDTYRIGAVEQLKIYSEILELPFEVINSVGDIERALNNLKDCDIIFVDTTGRSTKNIMQLSELKLYIDRIKPDCTYLVISMTTKYQDMLHILKGFNAIKYDRIILTKFDETTTYGSILNVACNSDVPISYITAGQNVPDDIQEASKDRLLELVIGGGSI